MVLYSLWEWQFPRRVPINLAAQPTLGVCYRRLRTHDYICSLLKTRLLCFFLAISLCTYMPILRCHTFRGYTARVLVLCEIRD